MISFPFPFPFPLLNSLFPFSFLFRFLFILVLEQFQLPVFNILLTLDFIYLFIFPIVCYFLIFRIFLLFRDLSKFFFFSFWLIVMAFQCAFELDKDFFNNILVFLFMKTKWMLSEVHRVIYRFMQKFFKDYSSEDCLVVECSKPGLVPSFQHLLVYSYYSAKICTMCWGSKLSPFYWFITTTMKFATRIVRDQCFLDWALLCALHEFLGISQLMFFR